MSDLMRDLAPTPEGRAPQSVLMRPGSRRAAPAAPEMNHQRQPRREGLVGWWLRLSAPAWPSPPIAVAQRELLRKAELTSLSLLLVLACMMVLASTSLANPATIEALGVMGGALLIAAVLNRRGHTRVAAHLVPTVMLLLIAANLLHGGGLSLIDLSTDGLFVMPIVLVALLGDRRAPWIVAALAMGFVVGSVALEPHAVVRLGGGQQFDGLAYEFSRSGLWGLVSRPVILLFFAALFGWMGARSVDQAIRRADRAEEVARLERAVAEQKQQLEDGIAQILHTHIEVANGNYQARAPLGQDHVLWQIAHALNTLIARLQRSGQAELLLRQMEQEIQRSGQAELLLRRMEQEIRCVVQEMQHAKAGYKPLWPPPSGTPLDPLVAALRGQ